MARATTRSLAARIAFALLLLTVALIPTPRLTALRGPVQLSDLTLAAAAVCFAAHWLSRRPPLRVRPLILPLGLYLAAAALSLVNAPHLENSLTKIVGLGSLMATLALTLELLEPQRAELLADVWLAVVALVSLAVIGAIAGFYLIGRDFSLTRELAMNYGSLPSGNYPRVAGLYDNGNMLCNYLIASAALLSWRWESLCARLSRSSVVACAFAMAVAAVFTLSTGWGGFAVGAIVLVTASQEGFSARFRSLAPLGIAACAAFALFMMFITVVMIVPRGQGIPLLFPFADVSTQPSGRLAGWISVLDTIRKHPILGKGVGETVAHFTHRLAMQGISGGAAEHVFDLEAHNVWLGLWGQMGILGIAAFALLSLRLWLSAWRAADRRLAIPLLAGFAGALLYHGLFASIEDARHLWVFFGLMAAAPHLGGETPTTC